EIRLRARKPLKKLAKPAKTLFPITSIESSPSGMWDFALGRRLSAGSGCPILPLLRGPNYANPDRAGHNERVLRRRLSHHQRVSPGPFRGTCHVTLTQGKVGRNPGGPSTSRKDARSGYRDPPRSVRSFSPRCGMPWKFAIKPGQLDHQLLQSVVIHVVGELV